MTIITTTSQNPLREHIIFATIGAVASSVVGILPLQFGALIDHLHFSAQTTGYITTANLFGIAAGALLSTIFIKKFEINRGLVISLAILTLAELATTLVTDAAPVAFVRFCSGIGAGLVSGYVAAGITRYPKAERGFSLYMLGMFGISVLGLYFLPPFIASTGTQGLFFLLSAISSIPLLLIIFIRPPSPSPASTKIEKPSPFQADVISIALLTWILLLMTGNGALWAFIERAGMESGFSMEHVGQILSFSSLLGIIAALLVTPADKRFNSTQLIITGAALSLLSALILVYLANQLAFFIVGICLMSIAWAFTVPVAQSLLARHGTESNSTLAALSMLMYWGGLAIGPSVSGYIISATNNSQIAFWACALFYGLGLICTIPLLRSTTLRKSALTYDAVI